MARPGGPPRLSSAVPGSKDPGPRATRGCERKRKGSSEGSSAPLPRRCAISTSSARATASWSPSRGARTATRSCTCCMRLRERAPDRLRAGGREPRPGAARVPGARGGGTSPRGGRALPDDPARHLLGGEARRPRGQEHLPGLLPLAPGRPLRRGRRAGLQQDRPGPPPRRPHRDPAAQRALRRLAQDHAARSCAPGTDATSSSARSATRPRSDIAAFAAAMAFPIVPCDLCGSQPNLRRKRVKGILAELAAEHPAVKGNLLNALTHVVPSHLLDRDLQRALAADRGRRPVARRRGRGGVLAGGAPDARLPSRVEGGGGGRACPEPVEGPIGPPALKRLTRTP